MKNMQWLLSRQKWPPSFMNILSKRLNQCYLRIKRLLLFFMTPPAVKPRKPFRVAFLGLALSPLYYLSIKFNEAYKERKAEIIAENFAVQQSTDVELQRLYNRYKYGAIYTNRYAYILEAQRYINGQISWKTLYMALTHPTGKDIYNMAITQMKKRGLKPINADGKAVPEMFSLQNATAQELQYLYDKCSFFADYTNTHIYKTMWADAITQNNKQSWLKFCSDINGLTGRDMYDIIVGEMRRRGIEFDDIKS